MNTPENRPLFAQWPGLSGPVPHCALATLPTPVEALEGLAAETRAASVHIKRDDQSGALYGGNKVRKLEFLLARAVAEGRRRVLTFGAAGSNHALATALYARQAGLRSISMMVPQPNAHSVRRNLLRGLSAGVEFHYRGTKAGLALATLRVLQRCRREDGRYPMVIPPGGSSPLGAVGFVNGALELRTQAEAGLLPVPDRIYVPCGTMGTAMGLLLGLKAAGLPTTVVTVRVVDRQFVNEKRARKLFASCNRLLHEADAAFPLLPFPEEQFEFRDDFFGEEYALYTEASVEACRRAAEVGIRLEGTYTGKAFAALLHDGAQGRLAGKRVVFWNTYNGVDFANEIAGLDYHALPPAFYRYFEEDVQPLDRNH
ncbi:MAG: pyridoxal-phosphate dependent enzyme [Candidatus Hydrogenedentes bacterium]|nr:pyridoxal-phosphate dependent enzyme [Candidatus Hydrogenedentota bacterium]